jgi:hypothetical protein
VIAVGALSARLVAPAIMSIGHDELQAARA